MSGMNAVAIRRFVCVFLLGMGWMAGCGQPERVYVMAGVLNMRGEPSTRSKVLKKLARGTELTVIQRDGKWMQVRTSKEETGWVHGDYVGDPGEVRAVYAAEMKKRVQRRRAYSPAQVQTPQRQPSVVQEADPSKLNLSIGDLLAGFPENTVVEEVEPLDGEPRTVAATDNGVVIEFWGTPENLSRSALMVPVVDVPDEELAGYAELAVTYVRNIVPRWERDGAWMAEKLRELTRLDIGEGGFDTRSKSVRFEYIKPLGTVRVGVEPRGE
ncbi:MAG: SH3 domain-containing protein [bacterium]|nr:SH3 domain-containing protein [bacterium]